MYAHTQLHEICCYVITHTNFDLIGESRDLTI